MMDEAAWGHTFFLAQTKFKQDLSISDTEVLDEALEHVRAVGCLQACYDSHDLAWRAARATVPAGSRSAPVMGVMWLAKHLPNATDLMAYLSDRHSG